MTLDQIKNIYFIGAGGIGMSALVRYFLSLQKNVGGYDRTQSTLTEKLIEEGALIHYEDEVENIPTLFTQKEDTLIIYTPAIPKDNKELLYFQKNGFLLYKRSQVLGLITKSLKGLCVAGTHGKTTTSTMLAHLLHASNVGCNAFLGGISHNYHTNLLLDNTSPYAVIEADEFDRSFHYLHPYISIITSADPDHLDIYGNEKAYKESFEHYSSLIEEDGVLIIKEGVELNLQLQEGVRKFTYSVDKGDYHAENITIENGEIHFDFVGPETRINQINLGVPIYVNIENSIAAIAVALLCGVQTEEIKLAVSNFKGIERRFDFVLRDDKHTLINDYAHHPEEVKRSIESVRQLYNNKKITIIFQPHLYTRTQEFYKEFADSLSLADTIVLLDIYPARELPIEGVSSNLIYDNIKKDKVKYLSDKENICNLIEHINSQVILTLGAGDINLLMPKMKETLQNIG